MKIAVPVSADNQIEAHIGHCESYNVYNITDQKVISGIKSVKSPGGCGCSSDIASVLAADGVKVVLAAGIGGGSTNAFNKSGISVIRGCEGDAIKVVNLYLSGLVDDKGSSCHKHQPHNQHKEKHVSHHIPEIAGIQTKEHGCSCSHGDGNKCSN
jgi:predicted Fe-Mo cluster-binding NifX family protein